MTSTSPVASTRKRKLRKGAHSCWECKRRKARCIFTATQDVCVGCQQRGTSCISQANRDLASDDSSYGISSSNKRLRRVEAMLEVLVKGQEIQGVDNEDANVIASSVDTETAQHASTNSLFVGDPDDTPMPQAHSQRETLSESLYSLLPSPEEVRSLCDLQRYVPCFFRQALTRNYVELSAPHETPLVCAQLLELPPRNAPPVTIARKMLLIACIVQYPKISLNRAKWLTRADQMASAAIDLVTTKDDLLCNTERLECMLLESTYHAYKGNIRRAFSATRRAMTTACLLGIHRPLHQAVHQVDDRLRVFDPSYVWHRIVYTDRLFCLVLGLPQGAPDITHVDASNTSDLGREEALERAHCVIASRILQRNQNDIDCWSVTESIDDLIQTTASSLPSSWWLKPSLSETDSLSDTLVAATRLVSQVLHFNLINQTYLPYILKSEQTTSDTARYGHSRDVCATASREILHRYLAIQDSNFVAHAWLLIDLFTLVAAITLLLIHLHHDWRSPTQSRSVLAHMRSSDRAMIEQILEHMSKKAVSKAPQTLQELLAIEEEAFTRQSVGSGRIVKYDVDDRPYFELLIPYYGELRVNSVQICFERALDIDDIRSGMGMRAGPIPGLDESIEITDWLTVDAQSGAGEAYSGVENAFFDTFQGFLDGPPM